MSEQLVFAMSTKGILKIEEFNELFRAVSFQGEFEEETVDIDARRHMIRVLDALGYCEFDFDQRKVHMCEPALIRLPSIGLPKAVLVGARIPESIFRLRQAVKNEAGNALFIQLPQKSYGIQVPPLICIEADSKETLKRIAEACEFKCVVEVPAAWALAHFSAGVSDIKQDLEYVQRAQLSPNVRTFNVEKLVFVSGSHDSTKALSEYLDQGTRQRLHWYWNGAEAARVNRDWGRYVALADAEKAILLYDERLQQVAVPVTVPLPTLLARALTLCTGIAPAFARIGSEKISDVPAHHPVQIYSGISRPMAELIAGKLGQGLSDHQFDINEQGVLQ